MTDAIKKIAAALSEGKARQAIEAEARSLAEKQQAIIRAEAVILSAICRWTGKEVGPDDPVPIFRGGTQVGNFPTTFVSGKPWATVSTASLIEHRAEIERKVTAHQSVADAAERLIQALGDMTYLDRVMLEASKEEHLRNALRNPPPPLEVRLIGEIGPVTSAVIAASALANISKRELGELREELQKRKTKPGRPRNEAAHAVARELARLYAKITGKRPTYSEGADGLSGEYTPALREVFDALGWGNLSLRGPAEAAIAAVSEADMQHEEMPLGGLLSSAFWK